MENKSQLIVADSRILPDVFTKVLEVKKLMAQKGEKSFVSACRRIGISRSAYYKYKDSVLPFYETMNGKKVTLLLAVENFQGILSLILNIIADSKANILTINQNIPVNGLADISISLETQSMLGSIEDIVNDINKLPGVRNCNVLSRD